MDLVSELMERVGAMEGELFELRHRFHQIPEAGNHEHSTSAAVRDLLGGASYTSDTAVALHIGLVEEGSVILRAELDGLEIAEPAHRPWSSTNGWMHACGHDVHLAALLGIIRALRSMDGQLPIGVTAVFQPAEETNPSGAKAIVADREKVFINPIAAVGVHVHPNVEPGSVAAAGGPINASADILTIDVTGHGGHGGYPHHSQDPVLAVSAIVVALQQVVSRRIDPIQPSVVTIGSVQAGSAENVIPSTARALGTVRAMDRTTRSEVHEAIRSIATATATAYGCTAAVRIDAGMPALANDETLAATFRSVAERSGLPVAEAFRSMGADDFAFYGEVAPILMVFAGAPSTVAPVQLHSSDYLPDDRAVLLVARAIACGIAAAAELPRA